MAVLMEERRNYPYQGTGSIGSPGYFAVDAPEGKKFAGWQSCREAVQVQFDLTRCDGVWFAFGHGELPALVEFMNWAELTLCFREERTRFYRTQVGTVAWVHAAPFWRSTEMRKNIFTLMLRIAREYAVQREPRSIRKAMETQVYSGDTLVALERFMLGFTNYVGPEPALPYPNSYYIKTGWHQHFGKKDLAFCRSQLQPA